MPRIRLAVLAVLLVGAGAGSCLAAAACQGSSPHPEKATPSASGSKSPTGTTPNPENKNAPAITDIVPSPGSANTSVNITGVQFGDPHGTVMFGGKSATVERWTDTEILVALPAVTGTVRVVVTAKSGVPSKSFSFNVPPSKNAQVQQCKAEEFPLTFLKPEDADGASKILDRLFLDYNVMAETGAKTNPTGKLCVAPRNPAFASKKPITCNRATPATGKADDEVERCDFEEVVKDIDIDAFKGGKLNSDYVIHLSPPVAQRAVDFFFHPAPGLDLELAYRDYLVLVPSPVVPEQTGKSAMDTQAEAAAIKHDLELADSLYTRAKGDVALKAAMKSHLGGLDREIAEKDIELWLAKHTVRLTYLSPRDLALALQDLPDWTIQVRSFGQAITILPSDIPSLRQLGPYLSADAIERDVLYRQKQNEDKTSAQQSKDPGDAKPAPSSNTITTHSSATTNQPAVSGKTPGPPVTTLVDTVTTTTQSSTTPPTGSQSTGNQTPNASDSSDNSASDPSSVAQASAKDGAAPSGKTSSGGTPKTANAMQQAAGQNKNNGNTPSSAAKPAPTQQALRFDNVVRLYHLRQADKIAEAINKASSDGKDLVEALDDHGNNDLLLILPSPPGGADQSTPIRRAIAMLDLPRPQLSLQVWSYQISAKKKKNDPGDAAKVSSDVQATFEKLRDVVNESNLVMTQALRDGFGEILDEAQKAKGEPNFFDRDFKNYLTQPYHECVERDIYCLGYDDALKITSGDLKQGNGAAADATLGRLLFFVIAASDDKAPDLVECVIQAMQAGNCSSNLEDYGELAPLRFSRFREQLKAISTKRNLHILRAALLDFLFEYKWTVVYPNDFVPYNLQRTAHVLDGLLGPAIEAFNQDVDAYVAHQLRAVEASAKEKSTGMAARGMVQVATLSGSQAYVDGKVNNYFDITPPPSLNDILNTANQSNIAANLKNILEPKEIMILQALANFGSQPHVYAEITKEAKLTITPTTLDTASSAQLDVDFEVSEPSPPETVNQKENQKDLVDRVADHHVTTHVRVESLKLFQVSAFTMELSHPQLGWPVPVVGWAWEAIFGTTPGLNKLFRLPPYSKTEDNRSVAIVRAVVVPTAMDLGLSLPFEADRVRDPITDTADSLNTVAQAGGRLRPFHNKLIACILEGQQPCIGSVPDMKLSKTPEDLRDPTAP
jgi:hypothetical protein